MGGMIKLSFIPFSEKVPKHHQSIYYFDSRYEGPSNLKEAEVFYTWEDDYGSCVYEDGDEGSSECKGMSLRFNLQDDDDSLAHTFTTVDKVGEEFPYIYWVDKGDFFALIGGVDMKALTP